jgi:hypothetical protein
MSNSTKKGKKNKPSSSQIILAIFSIIIVLSVVLSLFINT